MQVITTIYTPPAPPLQCDHPGLISEAVEESLPRIRKTLLVDKLNRDQGTGYIDILKQAPFGGSWGHSFCVEERSVPDSPFNHIFYVENSRSQFFFFTLTLLDQKLKKKKMEILISVLVASCISFTIFIHQT